jgi:hypothetical protein
LSRHSDVPQGRAKPVEKATDAGHRLPRLVERQQRVVGVVRVADDGRVGPLQIHRRRKVWREEREVVLCPGLDPGDVRLGPKLRLLADQVGRDAAMKVDRLPHGG